MTTKSHLRATTGEIHELVAELTAQLGPTAVQAMTGVRDRSTPSRWAKPNKLHPPRREAETQLRLGYRVWDMLREAEGSRIAAAWMVGANPRLGEDTPLTAIRQGRASEVIGAADAFIAGMFAG